MRPAFVAQRIDDAIGGDDIFRTQADGDDPKRVSLNSTIFPAGDLAEQRDTRRDRRTSAALTRT